MYLVFEDMFVVSNYFFFNFQANFHILKEKCISSTVFVSYKYQKPCSNQPMLSSVESDPKIPNLAKPNFEPFRT